MKTCSRCGAAKALEQFNRDKSKADGRASRCRECNHEVCSAWYRQNTERHAAAKANLTPEQRERDREAQAAWRRANAARKQGNDRAWYAANKERARDTRRAWRDANREQMYASNRKRRRVLDRPLATVRREDIWQRDGGLCQLCGEPIDRSFVWPHPQSLTLDHVLPIARGGLHEPGNVQLAHSRCNLRKGSRAA